MKSIGKKILHFFILLLIIIIGTILYSRYIGIKGLAVKEYKIVENQLASNFHGLKIIHISDLHYGTSINHKDLNWIVKKINQLHPDVILFTGDLFDKNITLNEKEIDAISSSLSKLDALLGKYAIKGENDTNHKEWEQVMTNSGLTNLNDTFDLLYKNDYIPIMITGISSTTANKQSIPDKIKTSMDAIDSYNKSHDNSLYSILMMHEPDTIEKIDTKYYNLVVAGHSHGGQINIPVLKTFLLPEDAKNYYGPYYKVKNSKLYISSGIGTTTFTHHLFNRPSINLYRLTNK